MKVTPSFDPIEMDGQIVMRVTVMRVTKFFLSTIELQIQFSICLACFYRAILWVQCKYIC